MLVRSRQTRLLPLSPPPSARKKSTKSLATIYPHLATAPQTQVVSMANCNSVCTPMAMSLLINGLRATTSGTTSVNIRTSESAPKVNWRTYAFGVRRSANHCIRTLWPTSVPKPSNARPKSWVSLSGPERSRHVCQACSQPIGPKMSRQKRNAEFMSSRSPAEHPRGVCQDLLTAMSRLQQ